MLHLELAGQRLAAKRLFEHLQRIDRFAPAFDHAIDAKLVVAVGLDDLPSARSADDHLEPIAEGARFDRREQLTRVMRVDRLARRAENRGVDARRKRDPERIVGGHGDDARARTDELVQIRGIATDDVLRRKPPEQRGFDDPQAGGHVTRRPVVVVLDITPFRILVVEDALEPDGQRSHAHLDEVARVVDDFSERRGQNYWPAAVVWRRVVHNYRFMTRRTMLVKVTLHRDRSRSARTGVQSGAWRSISSCLVPTRTTSKSASAGRLRATRRPAMPSACAI